MYDAYEVLENTCERAVKELNDLNKKLSKDDNTVSKDDVQMMESLTHTIASSKKGIAMMDKHYDDGYSGKRYTMPNRRVTTRGRGYSRDNDMMSRLDDMYQNARDDREADVIRNIMNELR